MHLRRGDKLQQDPFRTLAKAADRIKSVVNHHNAKSVFLMTDIQNKNDIRTLNNSLQFINGIRRLPWDYNWRHEVQDMFVEMAICCLSDYFISSGRAYWASATPSRDIVEVRNIVFGFDKLTTYWFGKPGKRWTGPIIDTFTHDKDLLE
eukprot:NODE_5703_length_981_cov_30.213287_g5123_i0.p1 GENE.NODE_5703_length_981_cov_30.213287_g5123_i0~~NODE_5703_length_981_cov_30.213287_g5123_i0.p1  ORF type:complete len:149 (-),score=30.01 NODE_5703_length_981_cov_30.213287_g5123_i0:202-648(-)